MVFTLGASAASSSASPFTVALHVHHPVSLRQLKAPCRGLRRHAHAKWVFCRRAHAAQLLQVVWNLRVSITSGPAAGSTSSSSNASFGLRSMAGARFHCARDSGRYAACSSPAAYHGLSNGSHTFRVYATAVGVSGTATSLTWTVKASGGSGGSPGGGSGGGTGSGASPGTGGGLPPGSPGTNSPPPTPSGIVAVPGDRQVALSWKAVSSSSGISGYRVLRNGSQVTQVTGTSYTDTGLTNGTTYTYTVEAVDKSGRVSAQSTAVSATAVAAGGPPPPPQTGSPPPAPLTAWVAASGGSYTPLSDQAAAADVTPTPENRPANATPNNYMPSSGQLQAFYSATDNHGQTTVHANPYDAYVTGHYAGTTDDIIQWAAWKWGIPADWLRAEYVIESHWNQSGLGDEATVSASDYSKYPAAARAGGNQVYQSMGISQIKWSPDGSVGAGTEPLRWESTAFNADYQAATLRFYYDNPNGARSAWGDSSYAPGNAWASLGGWFSPYPWLNSDQMGYVAAVQADLASRPWAQPGF